MTAGETCKPNRKKSIPESEYYKKNSQNLNNQEQFFTLFALNTLSLNDQS